MGCGCGMPLMVNFGLWLCRTILDDYLWVVVVVVGLILSYGYGS